MDIGISGSREKANEKRKLNSGLTNKFGFNFKSSIALLMLFVFNTTINRKNNR